MRHDPAKLAGYLRDTATLYEQHARSALDWLALDWTQGRAASLEARVSGSGTSDPVSAAALAELERTMRQKSTGPADGHAMHPRSVLHRWVEAVHIIGLPVPAQLRAAAIDIEQLGVFDGRPDALHKAAKAVTDILHLCRPVSRETADKILEAEQRASFKYCDACESPTDELRSGYCDPCRKRVPHWEKLHPGEEFDRASFKEMICSDIVAGMIRRPGSPLFPQRQVVHVDDVA